MGNLHTLRRAIKRTPQKFMNEGRAFETVGHGIPRFTSKTQIVCLGAEFREGQWQPAVVNQQGHLFPYRRFVRATLRELGFEIPI